MQFTSVCIITATNNLLLCICGFGWQGSGIKNEMRKNEDSDLRYKHTIVINFHCLVCNYGHTCLCKLSMC